MSGLLLPPAELYANAGRPAADDDPYTVDDRYWRFEYRELVGFDVRGPYPALVVLDRDVVPARDPNERDGEWRSAAFFPHREICAWYEERGRLVDAVVPLYGAEFA